MGRTRILGTALLAAACAEGAGGWGGVVRDSAGVTVVENPTTPIRSEPLPVREVLRIGSTAGEAASPSQFGLIASVAVGDDGEIVVLDQQNREVRVFGPDGRFLDAMGRGGSGPGELSGFAVAALVGRGDTIIVADPGNGRFQWFAEGAPIAERPMTVPAGMTPNRFALLPGLRIVCMTTSVPTPEDPEVRDNLLVLVARSGIIADTLGRMPGSRALEYRGGTARFSAYVAEPVWAVDADGTLYSTLSDTWRIEVRDSTGALRRVIAREHTPRPVTEADRRAFLALLRRTLRDQNVDPALIEQMAAGMRFADTYPAFAHFLPGPHGTLWVQRIRTAEDAGEASFDAANVGSDRWDVFDPEGRYVANARLPARFTPLVASGDRFYGVWRDDLDVQHVLVVEVSPP